MRHSLRLKLLASFMLLIVVVLGSALFGVSLLVKEHAQMTRQQELQAKGTELATTLQLLYAEQGDFSGLDDILADADSYLGARVWVVDLSGQVVNISGVSGEHGFGRGGMGMGPGMGMGAGMGQGRMQNGQMRQHKGLMGTKSGPIRDSERNGKQDSKYDNNHDSKQELSSEAKHDSEQEVHHSNLPTGSEANGRMQTCLDELQDVLDGALQKGRIGTKIYNNRYYGQQMLMVAVPVSLENGQRVGAVLLHEPYSNINDYMRQVYAYLGLAGLLAVLVALVLVFWLTRRIVHPLTAMQQAATAMAKGDYEQKVPVDSDDEVGRLGLALNSLAGDLNDYIARINQQEKLRRDFAANVSHELRTPLTIIRGYDEALLAGAAENETERREYCELLHEETLRLERLISDLLDLSRLQGHTSQKAPMEMERLPLAELAAGLVHKLKRQAQQKEIQLTLLKKDPAPFIKGNGDRIMQLLLIFVDNALKYTPAGGKVTLTTFREEGDVTGTGAAGEISKSAAAGETNKSAAAAGELSDKFRAAGMDQGTISGPVAVIQIVDTGKGIPAEDLPYVWERFYKVDKSHSRDDSGTGLGLAIAREILALHQAQVRLDSQVGRGTTVTIRFPAV